MRSSHILCLMSYVSCLISYVSKVGLYHFDPRLVTFAQQVQAIVGIHWVQQIVIRIFQLIEQVHISCTQFRTDVLQLFVDLLYLGRSARVTPKRWKSVVDRQNTLNVDLGFG